MILLKQPNISVGDVWILGIVITEFKFGKGGLQIIFDNFSGTVFGAGDN